MKNAGLALIITVLLTLLLGAIPSALAWEAASLSPQPSAMLWVLGVYLVFLFGSYLLVFLGAKFGAFHNFERAKYHLLNIKEEPEAYLDDKDGD